MSRTQLVVRTDHRPTQWAHDVIDRLRARGVHVEVIPDLACDEWHGPPWLRWVSGRRLRSAMRIPARGEKPRMSADAWLDLRRRPHAGAAPPRVDCFSLAIGTESYGLPAFDEALRGAWHVEVQLHAVAAGHTRVARRGAFPYASTYGRTLDLILNECVSWFDDLKVPMDATQTVPAVARAVDARTAIQFGIRELRRVVSMAIRWAFDEPRWNVGVADATPEQFLSRQAETPFRWLGNKRESLADPFPVRVNGQLKILCEAIGNNRIGRIAAIDGAGGAGRSTLLNGTHVSYPFVYCTDDKTYVLPERSAAGRLDLFEIVGEKAIYVATLLADRGLVDPTLTELDGRFWLFGTDPKRLPNAALHAFWAETLLGPWHPHALNPIKIDVRSARPAGNFFRLNGALHRPAQDCAGRYGRAVVINRIERLDPEVFEETPVARIDPESLGLRGAVGVHTLSSDGSCLAIDAQFARWWWRKPLVDVLGRMRNKQSCAS